MRRAAFLTACCFLAGAAWLPTCARAESRGLVVVVEKYASPDVPSILSIDKDVENGCRILKGMGFPERGVKVLRGTPSKEAIASAFREWLVAGTSPGDAVAFYYSGHGAQIRDDDGDEDDGLDEFLVPGDFRFLEGTRNADPRFSLTDDELNGLLQQLGGRRVVLLIDSCHSGTISKQAGAVTASRYLPTADVALARKPAGLAGKDLSWGTEDALRGSGGGTVWLELSACRPEQQSFSLEPRGGVFSQFFLEGLGGAAAGSDGRITPQSMKEYIDRRDEEAVRAKGDSRFKPQSMQVNGSSVAAGADLRHFADGGGAPAPESAGPSPGNAPAGGSVGELFENLLGRRSFGVSVSPASLRCRPGEVVSFTLAPEAGGAGYLTVFWVDEDDKPTLVFPNQWNPDDVRVEAAFRFPQGARRVFRLQADGSGVQRVYVLLTDTPLDLYRQGGDPAGLFKAYSAQGERELRGVITKKVRLSAGGFGMGRLEISVAP